MTDTLSSNTAPPTAPNPAPETDARTVHAERRLQRLIFLVVSAGFVMSSLDMMIVNVAFPVLQRDFAGATTGGLSWTLNAYSIIFAALLIPAGRISDRQSKRAGFLFGTTLFTVASALCAMADSVPTLVAARVLQAIGAAALVPTSLGLLLAAYPEERRAGAVRAWTAVGGIAAALAPIVGGALVDINWRWIFLINLPIGVLSVVLGMRVLPESERAERAKLPDLLGSVMLVAGVGLIALGLVQAPTWGWTSGEVLGSLAGGAVIIALFFLRCSRHPVPVVPLGLLKVRSFAVANLAAMVFSASFAAMLFSVMMWAQDVWGYSPLRIGLALAPGTFFMPIVAMRAGKIIARIGAPRTAALGCTMMAVGIGWWAFFADATPNYVGMLLVGCVLTPVGSILTTATLVGLVTADLPAVSFATGSAVNVMIRQAGFVIGVSVFIAALGTPGNGDVVGAFQRGWLVAAVIGLAGAGLALVIQPRRRRT